MTYVRIMNHKARSLSVKVTQNRGGELVRERRAGYGCEG